MNASEVRQIMNTARQMDYDYIVDHYMKKIKRAAYVGESQVDVPIVPWLKPEIKHIKWFENKGYTVAAKTKSLIISWSERPFSVEELIATDKEDDSDAD